MKLYQLAAITISIFVSNLMTGCSNSTKSQVEKSSVDKTDSVVDADGYEIGYVTDCDTSSDSYSDSIRNELLPLFKGIWILSEYKKDLMKTKSPKKSFEKQKDITEMMFWYDFKDDTLKVPSEHNGVWAYSFNILSSKGKSIKSLKTDIGYPHCPSGNNFCFCDIEAEVNEVDTFLNICVYDSKCNLYKKLKFEKIWSIPSRKDFAAGSGYFINQLLFSGKYITMNPDINKVVTFKANGSVNGLDGYSYYTVEKHFHDLEFNNHDNIMLCNDYLKCDKYLYTFVKDTIFFYNPIVIDEDKRIEFGDLEFMLLRLK